VPGDFDASWDPVGVDPDRLEPVLLDFRGIRAAQKAKYGGELFVSSAVADLLGTRFLDFFQRDAITGRPKGSVAIDPESVP
jgi:hypothetical protein